ncbi:MAG: alpha/beta hydrolase [Oscillospiraceae bacterium]|nr:alpha/beta hydrolase [Oscillospiraceae bacterium]
MSVIRKIFRVIGKILLILLIICLVLILVLFIVNKILCSREFDKLSQDDLSVPVSVGDYNLNVFRYGNQEGEHTIVGIAGFSCSDISVTFRPLTDQLAEENLIVMIDRAGYGLSDDTTEPQTVERIVNDYRTALRIAGIKGPYVLLPHSIGGVYATYWQSNYPSEIEGIAFLDGSVLSEKGFEGTLDTGVLGYAEAAACKAGLLRPFYRKIYLPLPEIYSQKQQEMSDALTLHSGYSFAANSEGRRAEIIKKFLAKLA